jgi:phosphate transport system protein
MPAADSPPATQSAPADFNMETRAAGGISAPDLRADEARLSMAANPSQAVAASASESAQIMALTLDAVQLAKSAVAHAIDGLAQKSSAPFLAVSKSEQELDRLDREVDQRVTHAVTRASEPEAGQLLACMKFMIDLERIGDLICSFGGRAQAIGSKVEMDDVKDLIQMATVLEQMLADIHQAFSRRDLERVLKVLRADAEIDRIRNLIFIRHVENSEGIAGPEGIHVLFMAQALERAGDHTKNLAEEVCHLVTGQTVRHAVRTQSKSEEQMFLDWLRQRRNPE